MIPAIEARDAGFVSAVVSADQLVDRAVALGEELADQPLATVRLIRPLIHSNANEASLAEVQRREAVGLREAYRSPEHREAVTAFLEKRKPDFAKARQTSSLCARHS